MSLLLKTSSLVTPCMMTLITTRDNLSGATDALIAGHLARSDRL